MERAKTLDEMARRLREDRERAGLTQKQLGEWVSLSRVQVNRLENARHEPGPETAEALARVLGAHLRETRTPDYYRVLSEQEAVLIDLEERLARIEALLPPGSDLEDLLKKATARHQRSVSRSG